MFINENRASRCITGHYNLHYISLALSSPTPLFSKNGRPCITSGWWGIVSGMHGERRGRVCMKGGEAMHTQEFVHSRRVVLRGQRTIGPILHGGRRGCLCMEGGGAEQGQRTGGCWGRERTEAGGVLFG